MQPIDTGKPNSNAPPNNATCDRMVSLSKTYCANESAIVGLTSDGGSAEVSWIVQNCQSPACNLRRRDHAQNARSMRRVLRGHGKEDNAANCGRAFDVNSNLISHDLDWRARNKGFCCLGPRAAQHHPQNKQTESPGSQREFASHRVVLLFLKLARTPDHFGRLCGT